MSTRELSGEPGQAPFVLDLSDAAESTVITLDWLIWAVFTFELSAKTYLAPARLMYLRRHWVDVLIVVLPFLRPLRVIRSARSLRAVRAVRLLAVFARSTSSVRAVLGRRGLQYTLALGLASMVGAALAVTAAEREGGGAITDVGTAAWWAVVTVTTVGYGDVAPTTPVGRGIAVFLMVVGVAVFGVLTASIAAFFVEQRHDAEERVTNADLLTELQTLGRRLDDLERQDANSEQ